MPFLYTLHVHHYHLDKPHKTHDMTDTSEVDRVRYLPHLQYMHADVDYGISHVIFEHEVQDPRWIL